MSRKKKPAHVPNMAQIEADLVREQYKIRYGKTLRSTPYALIAVAAVAVLIVIQMSRL